MAVRILNQEQKLTVKHLEPCHLFQEKVISLTAGGIDCLVEGDIWKQTHILLQKIGHSLHVG